MAEDSKKQIDELKKQAKSLEGVEREQTRANTLAKVNQRIAEANNDISELRNLDRAEEANELQAEIAELTDKISKNTNLNSVIKRLDEANELAQKSNEAASRALSAEELFEKNKETITRPLTDLNEELKLQTDRMNTKTDAQVAMDKLQGAFSISATKQSNEIMKAFREANNKLEKATKEGDEEQIKLALAQLEAVKESADNEEKRREAVKAQEEANDALLKTAEGVTNLGSKFDDFASNAASGVGFIATLAGLALLFLDPEKFAELIAKVIKNIATIFSGIYDLFTGDIEGGLNTIKDNLGLFGAALGGILLFLGGPLLRGLGVVLKVAKVFRAFILGAWVPGMIATFKGMAASFMAMLKNPVALVAAGVAALFVAIGIALSKLKDALGPGASIMDTLKVAALGLLDFLSMLVNAITFIPRKIIGLIGPAAAKFLFGDDFDTSAIESLAGGLRTDRASTAFAEIKEENERKAALEAEQNPDPLTNTEDPFAGIPGLEGLEMPEVTTGGELMGMEGDNLDLERLLSQSSSSQTILKQTNAPSTSSRTNTTIIQQPRTPASNVLSGDFAFAR